MKLVHVALRTRLPHLALLCLCCTGSLRALPDDARAYAALMHGRLGEATTLLRQEIAANAADAHAHQLLCRTAYAEEQADLAVSECLLAVEDAPQDARNQLWLGRAFGQKASHTNPVSAYKLAGRVREAFERAVQLDPNDIDSVSDLSEFYLSAPGVVGGDAQRATELANSLLSRAPARAHRLLGMLAHKNGDDARAEEEFRLAVAAGHTPEAWSDLALFYAQTHAYDRAKDTVEQALAADTRHGPVEVDAATILITVRRAPDLAERALRNYITSDAQTDEAPVPRARVLLGKLLAKRGDTIGARHEFSEAVALAPEYEQAQKALNSL